jgi:hypothetical protein
MEDAAFVFDQVSGVSGADAVVVSFGVEGGSGGDEGAIGGEVAFGGIEAEPGGGAIVLLESAAVVEEVFVGDEMGWGETKGGEGALEVFDAAALRVGD